MGLNSSRILLGVKYGWKGPMDIPLYIISRALQLKDKTKISVQDLLGKFI